MLIPAVQPPFPLTWGFSTRLDDPAGLPPVRLRQIHGDRVVPASETIQDADGLWTMEPGLAIGVRVADCVPVLLAGPIHGRPWIAALHAGWRGATAGILRRGVSAFTGLGGDPAQLVWALGPAILACHFEVGEEVLDAARQDSAWNEGFAQPGPRGRPHLDLHGFLRGQALDLGLRADQDGTVARCTYCEEALLHSFRRGDLEGRQWGLAAIRPSASPGALQAE